MSTDTTEHQMDTVCFKTKYTAYLGHFTSQMLDSIGVECFLDASWAAPAQTNHNKGKA